MKRYALLCLAVLLYALQAEAQMAIGTWRDCFDYSYAIGLAVGKSEVYVAAQGGVFSLDAESDSYSTLSRSTGLSDVGLQTIAYDASTDMLVVGYANANIDLVQGRMVYNLSDIKRADAIADRSLHRIRFNQHKAYVCCGFGVVVIDLDRQEVDETLYLGLGGSALAVYDIAFLADSIYAATAEGLKRIAAGARLGISDRWQTDTRRPSTIFSLLGVSQGKLLAVGRTAGASADSLFRLEADTFACYGSGTIKALQCNSNGIAVTYADSVVMMGADLEYSYRFDNLYCTDAALGSGGTLWATSPWDGLLCFPHDAPSYTFHPEGPYTADNTWRLRPTLRSMMVMPGGHTTTYDPTYLPANMPVATNRSWRNISLASGVLSGVNDAVDVAVNPYDTSEAFVALWHHGVAHLRNGEPQALYTESNTDGALLPYVEGDYSTLRPGALAFDPSGNLWVLTALSTHGLARRSPSGEWTGFATTALGQQLYVDRLVYDTIRNLLWFSGRPNYLYVHDGKSRMVRINPNNGSKLSTDMLNTFVQDHEGNIWIGTNKGIKVVYNTSRLFDRGGNGEEAAVECSNITITNGEFAEYLMAYESISDIVVDGANRKWVGTQTGGLYLISANGQEQIEHFTTANSPLCSDKIVCLGIQPTTGEVYIGTDRGLQVYRSDATYATALPSDTIRAFPNPVRPDYDGPIAIKGFTRNALVRITDAAGHTLFSTTAQGGQAIWDGRTQSGRRVAAGVYYVFASDSQGSNRSVGKILVVR